MEATENIWDFLSTYSERARQASKSHVQFLVTPSEMEVLLSEADTEEKRQYISKHYKVYEYMDENWDFRQRMIGKYDPDIPTLPRNRAERRQIKFGRKKS